MADEFPFVLVGVPEELGVEPIVERCHVAVDAHLRLGAGAGDADRLVVAGRVAEGVEVGERNEVTGEVAVVLPDVGAHARVRHLRDALECEGGAFVVVGREAVVAPEFGRRAAHVGLKPEVGIVGHASAVVEEDESELRVLLGEVAGSAVRQLDELDVGCLDAFGVGILGLEREALVALAEVGRVSEAE